MLFIGWFLAGTGITVGYHRLFAHRTFKAYSFIEWIYMFLGSAALQNTIVNWCSDHRKHHKKLDTEEDPYSIKKGFIHAHIGWVVKKSSRTIENVSDLRQKSSIKFQEKFYKLKLKNIDLKVTQLFIQIPPIIKKQKLKLQKEIVNCNGKLIGQ